MAGMTCFVCSFDARVVKLTTLDTFDAKGKPIQETVCVGCKPIALQHNHPLNENADQNGQQGNVEGYIKPSNPNSYPPVRPQ